MPVPSVRIRDLVYTIVTARTGSWRWLTPVTLIGLTVLTFLGGIFGQDHDTKSAWGWLVAGGLSVLVVGSFPVLRELAAVADQQVDLAEAARLRVTLRDALQPMSERIARMSAMTSRPKRERELRLVRADAVQALIIVLRDIDQLRAVVYELADDGSQLGHVEYGGRGGPHPADFSRAEPEGAAVIELIKRGEVLIEGAVDGPGPVDEPGTGTGADDGSRSRVAVSVNDGINVYGMLSVDAPAFAALTRLDQHLLEVVSNLLAIAYALTRS